MSSLVTVLKRVWNFIDQLNTQVKSLIIVILVGVIMSALINQNSKTIIKDYLNQTEQQDQLADQYTMKVAPKLHECVQTIANLDQDCYNVLLLNYHNSKKSLQGIRYVYLNCMIECPKGINDEQVKEYWSDLEYIYYQDELSKIHNQGYLRISNIEDIKTTFPKLYKKLQISGAVSAAFYCIEGVNNPIGMVIVLYKKQKFYSSGYYSEYISPYTQKLSTLLDYPNLNELK